MTNQDTLRQIAAQIASRYRNFLLTGKGGESLPPQERALIVQLRDDANNVSLEALRPLLNTDPTDSMVATRAYGFLATILDQYSQGVRETYWGANAPREEVSITSPGASFIPEQRTDPVATTLVDRIAGYLPEPYRSHFLAKSRDLREVQEQFPDATAINETDRDFIYAARLLVDTDGSRSQIFDYLADYVGDRRIADDDNKAILEQQNLIEEFRRAVAAPAPGREEIRIPDPLGRIPEEGGFGRPFTPSPTAGATPTEFATGAEDIEPGEAARPGAAAGMVSSVTIQPGGAGEGDGDAGAGTGGGVGGVPAAETPYADAVPEDWEIAASEIYGAYFHIIKQDPQVAELIAQAAFEEWEPDKFKYQLEQTNWWKTTSEATRKFDNLYARDPATAQADVDRYAQELKQDALDLNIRLSGEQLNKLAYDALRGGMTKQQVTNALGMLATTSGEGVTSLRYGYYGNTINKLASDYGVSLSDGEFNQLVDRFAVGQENETSLTSSFQAKATALFPALSERLMAGETFSQIVEPYRYRASQILGRDFAATDFMDNDSFSQAVTYVGDDGKQRPMTYTEWGQYLRSNREFGYEFTDEAQSRAYMVANRIADIFGAV